MMGIGNGQSLSKTEFRGFILLITFFIYTCYHMSRKPISVVKSRLHHNCSGIIQPTNNTHSINDTTWCNWAPFDQSNYKELLGAVRLTVSYW